MAQEWMQREKNAMAHKRDYQIQMHKEHVAEEEQFR